MKEQFNLHGQLASNVGVFDVLRSRQVLCHQTTSYSAQWLIEFERFTRIPRARACSLTSINTCVNRSLETIFSHHSSVSDIWRQCDSNSPFIYIHFTLTFSPALPKLSTTCLPCSVLVAKSQTRKKLSYRPYPILP